MKKTSWPNVASSNSLFVGYYPTEASLVAKYPTAPVGSYATIGATDTVWIWDDTGSEWIDSGTKGGVVTSVFGRVGDVDAANGDYTNGQVGAEVAGARAAHEGAYDHSELHSHGNITELNKVSVGDHDTINGNPHGTTASQVGADPVGEASAERTAHELFFNHALLHSHLLANQVWVDKNGNDTTGILGDISKPFLTIQAAMNACKIPAMTASDKFIVNIGVGIYTEDLTWDPADDRKIVLSGGVDSMGQQVDNSPSIRGALTLSTNGRMYATNVEFTVASKTWTLSKSFYAYFCRFSFSGTANLTMTVGVVIANDCYFAAGANVNITVDATTLVFYKATLAISCVINKINAGKITESNLCAISKGGASAYVVPTFDASTTSGLAPYVEVDSTEIATKIVHPAVPTNANDLTNKTYVDGLFNTTLWYANSILVDPAKSELAGHRYQTIKAAADYINATVGAPLIILVPNGTYNIEETVIFKKAVQIIGQSKENTIINFTYNAANKWVRNGDTYPYYGRACFYWGDVVDGGTYYTRALLRMNQAAGAQNMTICTKSRALSHLMGYVSGEAGSPRFRHLKLRTEKEPVAVFGYARGNIFAIDWYSPNTATTAIAGMPQYASVEDVELNPFTQLTGLLSAIGTTAVTGVGTLFQSELYVGAYISKGGNQYKVVNIWSDTSITIDRALTCTDNEFLAYMPFDCGIKINCFDHPFDHVVQLKVRDVNLMGVLNQSFYISGFANADFRNVLINGCSWENTGQAAGATHAFELSYTDYVNFNGFRASHQLTNHYEYSGGLWNLFYVPNGVLTMNTIQVPGTPAKTVTWHDGIRCQGGSTLVNITFGSYTIAQYTVSIPSGQNNISISNMRDVSTGTYSIYIPDTGTKISIQNVFATKGIYFGGSGKISNSRFSGDSTLIPAGSVEDSDIEAVNTDFTATLTLTTNSARVWITNCWIDVLTKIASNANVFINNSWIQEFRGIKGSGVVITNSYLIIRSAITGYAFELSSYICKMIGNTIIITTGGSVSDALIYAVSNSCVLENSIDTTNISAILKVAIKALDRNRVSKNYIYSVADADSVAVIQTTGSRNVIEGNVIQYTANPNPIPAILIGAGDNNVVNGNIAESFATVVSDSGTNTQLALNVN